MNIDDDLKKTQLTKFWNCVSYFRTHNSYTIHLDVNGTNVVETVEAAEAFENHC
jgi:hypothetical protein